MTFHVTVQSANQCLDEMGSRCPNVSCGSPECSVEAELGNNNRISKENFTCHVCRTEWTVSLFASQIESILPPDGDEGLPNYRRTSPVDSERVTIDRGVFSVIPCPKGPIADALTDLLKAMRLGSAQKRGAAIAQLALLARVDIRSLPGNQPEVLPETPSAE